MTTYFSSLLTKIIMANYHYHYQISYYPWFLLAIFILLIQIPIIAIAQQTQYESMNAANVSPNNNPRSTLTTTTITKISENNIDDADYSDDNENNGAEIYDDGGDLADDSPTSINSQSKFNHHNITSQVNGNIQLSDYDDEAGSYQDNLDDDDDDEIENHIYGDTMSVNRPESKRPIIESINNENVESPSTSRIPFVSSNFWRNLFSKPAILVGIVGGIVIGMLSAILLVMFIIYRMRKKDEGSYALEEGSRKSPSHAYTRVSSREFFA